MTDESAADADKSELRYDAVFWDIGGVLLDLDSVRASHEAFLREFLAARDVEVSVADALAEWREVVGAHFRERDGTAFRSALEGYGKGVDAIVGEHVPRDAWFPAFREAGREHLRATPRARGVLERLHRDGVYQAVVSDVDDEECAFILDHLGLAPFLDDVTTSESVGRTKPDDAMFEAALEKSPHSPEKTVMVGDRYDHDVAGAAAHGIRPVAFGADDGPAVAHRITDLAEVLEILGVDD